MEKFCIKCGAERYKNSDFCIKCGTKYGMISQKSDSIKKLPMKQGNIKPQGFMQLPKTRSLNTKKIGIFTSIIVIFIFITLLVILFSSDKPAITTDNTQIISIESANDGDITSTSSYKISGTCSSGYGISSIEVKVKMETEIRLYQIQPGVLLFHSHQVII